MGEQYAGDEDNFPEDYTIPDDSDPPTAAAMNPGFEALGDRTAWLKKRVDALVPLANLAALTAITTPDNDMLRLVERYGWYSFDASATDTAHSPWILAANDATPGRWVRDGSHTRKVHRVFSAARGFTTALGGVRTKAAAFHPHSITTQYLGSYPSGIITYSESSIVNGGLVFPVAFVSGPTGGVQWCLDDVLIEGATLEAVWALVDPANGRAGLPSNPISVGVFKSDIATGSMVSLRNTGDFVDDPSASVAAYEANHALIYTPNQHNVISKIVQSYYLQVWNEWGTNILNDNAIRGFYILQSKAADLGWGDDY